MSYWIGSPAFGVAVDAGEVEVVVGEEREHVLGEIGSLDDSQYRDYGGHPGIRPTTIGGWRKRGGSRTN